MISGDTQSQQALKSIARLEQIRDALLQSKRNEREARDASETSGRGRDTLPLDLEVRFLVERVELYNETAQIESDLVHMGAEPPGEADKDQIVALARQLDLARALREERLESMAAKGCWIGCEQCTASCTECVTNCGLSGDNFGSSCHAGALVSACRPNPGF